MRSKGGLMNSYNSNQEIQARPRGIARTNALLRNAYLWMALGLAMTGVVAYLVAANPQILRQVYSNPIGLFLVAGIQIGLVIFLSARIQTMRVGTAVLSFIIYSMVTGFSLSSILLAYTGAMVARAFFTACLMFAAMGLYGISTRRDLSKWYSYLFMGLIGVLIASVINMFLGSSSLDYMISIVGVVLFMGITAWDTQKIVHIGSMSEVYQDEDSYVKLSILAALTLYLDFINIFLFLLRLFSRGSSNR